MAGIRPNLLVCKGFIEAESFERSKAELMQETGLTPREVDDRVEAVVWALARVEGADAEREAAEITVQPVPNRNLWAAVIPRGIPPLRLYLRPRSDVAGECEWLWIERRP
jgi:hypothetical protein